MIYNLQEWRMTRKKLQIASKKLDFLGKLPFSFPWEWSWFFFAWWHNWLLLEKVRSAYNIHTNAIFTLICNNISINDTHEITGRLGDCSTTTETQATENPTKRPDYSTTNSSDVIENVTTNANTGKSERGYWQLSKNLCLIL